jgi:hypothetical protein
MLKNNNFDFNLTKIDKKEIIKNFIEDMDVKKYIFAILNEK